MYTSWGEDGGVGGRAITFWNVFLTRRRENFQPQPLLNQNTIFFSPSASGFPAVT